MGVDHMTRSIQSRVKYLRLALQEAHKAGDVPAVKRLTALLTKLLHAPIAQARIH
jgi:hypothetical protein